MKEGETLPSIADQYGFFWETLWNHPGNEGLRKKRKDPASIFPGDIVHIPDRSLKTESCVTGQVHRFRKKTGVLLPLTHWVAIELLETDRSPVAFEPYEIKLPNGAVRAGKLDRDGKAREERIPAGLCIVRFPDRDFTCFEDAVSGEIPGERWLRIEVLEGDGKPVAGELYRLELPTGEIMEGKLDASGRAELYGLRADTCTVTFPERDAEDFVGAVSTGA